MMYYKLDKLFYYAGRDCNLNCRHCFLKKRGSYIKNNNEMSSEIVKFMISNNIPELRITGGEPTLNNQVLELLKSANNNSIFVSLYTNGLLLTTKWFNAFLRNRKNKIVISLYGVSQFQHNYFTKANSFNRIMGNIKNARDLNIKVDLTVPLSSYIYKDIDSLLDICERLKISTLKFVKLSPPFDDPESIKPILMTHEMYLILYDYILNISENFSFDIRLPKETKTCLIFSKNPLLSITEDGNIYACCIHVYDDKYFIGNIFENGIDINERIFSNFTIGRKNEKNCLLQFT